jgi:hypothetical protein
MSEACISQMQSDIRKHSGDSDLIESSQAQFQFGGSVPSPTHEVAIVRGTRRKVDWGF